MMIFHANPVAGNVPIVEDFFIGAGKSRISILIIKKHPAKEAGRSSLPVNAVIRVRTISR
jgi:hypothetical protein